MLFLPGKGFRVSPKKSSRKTGAAMPLYRSRGKHGP